MRKAFELYVFFKSQIDACSGRALVMITVNGIKQQLIKAVIETHFSMMK